MWLFGSRLFGCFAVAALHPAVRLFGSRLLGCFAVAALHPAVLQWLLCTRLFCSGCSALGTEKKRAKKNPHKAGFVGCGWLTL